MELYQQDCLERLKLMPDNSVDAIVTDPPAGIGFMNKEWDSHKGGRDQWMQWLTDIMTESMRVLKAGGHCLVWAIPRTSHWTAMACEDAGFEVRDCVYHINAQGFPKSLNISKAIDKKFGAERQVIGKKLDWRIKAFADGGFNSGKTIVDVTNPSTDLAKTYDGYGSQLKPAVECWWLLRKPLEGKSIVDNVLLNGCGGINIDKSRIPTEEMLGRISKGTNFKNLHLDGRSEIKTYKEGMINGEITGRFPSNLIHDGSDEVLQEFAKYGESKSSVFKYDGTKFNTMHEKDGRKTINEYSDGTGGYDDTGSVARFFYNAKASTSERNLCNSNNHPTVKSVKLMSYLVNLIAPPITPEYKPVILDMFMGTGTTGIAVLLNGYDFIGIELQEDYYDIATTRINNYEKFRKYL